MGSIDIKFDRRIAILAHRFTGGVYALAGRLPVFRTLPVFRVL
jgi:hypothetical protein